MFGNVLVIARWFASGPDIRIAQKLEALKHALSRRLWKRSRLQSFESRFCVVPYFMWSVPFSHAGLAHRPNWFRTSVPWSGNLVDRKAYAPALESKSFSKKSLSLIGSPHAKTADDSR